VCVLLPVVVVLLVLVLLVPGPPGLVLAQRT
jgi:hypothetical protein